ncbi:MAG: DUF2188 domain-containing protein [Candidatus Cloacimonetes bacterium]|nr:DUF2188 domain-containing protein [Candidatus Cloacimonadota bacterium]
MSMKQNVVPRFDGGWGIRKEGNVRPSGKYSTQKAAIKVATRNCKAHGGVLIIHRKDGSVRQKCSFHASSSHKK